MIMSVKELQQMFFLFFIHCNNNLLLLTFAICYIKYLWQSCLTVITGVRGIHSSLIYPLICVSNKRIVVSAVMWTHAKPTRMSPSLAILNHLVYSTMRYQLFTSIWTDEFHISHPLHFIGLDRRELSSLSFTHVRRSIRVDAGHKSIPHIHRHIILTLSEHNWLNFNFI